MQRTASYLSVCVCHCTILLLRPQDRGTRHNPHRLLSKQPIPQSPTTYTVHASHQQPISCSPEALLPRLSSPSASSRGNRKLFCPDRQRAARRLHRRSGAPAELWEGRRKRRRGDGGRSQKMAEAGPGILVAGVGIPDRRWGLQGEGLRLPGERSEKSRRGQRA
ncbi:Hypothetical predicted protein [Marmota monax]|uniref:Uncharacterized protein n=1 Tax=Marmota monax TaxID=9995 RepID=A0A5E4CH81_MARMO|nr:hypothetical protein GHT09_008311 [Marmota monax]VTJ81175.1 Hypothetical predicted protein [Marmota monax]